MNFEGAPVLLFHDMFQAFYEIIRAVAISEKQTFCSDVILKDFVEFGIVREKICNWCMIWEQSSMDGMQRDTIFNNNNEWMRHACHKQRSCPLCNCSTIFFSNASCSIRRDNLPIFIIILSDTWIIFLLLHQLGVNYSLSHLGVHGGTLDTQETARNFCVFPQEKAQFC